MVKVGSSQILIEWEVKTSGGRRNSNATITVVASFVVIEKVAFLPLLSLDGLSEAFEESRQDSDRVWALGGW